MSSTLGQRKAALYLAALSIPERRALMSALPASTVRGLNPLIDQLVRLGWTHRPAVEAALAEELRGLTADTTLGVDALLRLARRLPPGWYARVVAAAGPVDSDFLLALLDDQYAQRVREALRELPAMPPVLADAVLAEAMLLDSREGAACAA
jgi:hypothetical protein